MHRSLAIAALVAGLVALPAVPARAECSEWLRTVALPKLGCDAAQIEAICSGQMAVPSKPYCDYRNKPPAGMGDWCQTTMGGCQLPGMAQLNNACQCPSAAGMIQGRVTTQ